MQQGVGEQDERSAAVALGGLRHGLVDAAHRRGLATTIDGASPERWTRGCRCCRSPSERRRTLRSRNDGWRSRAGSPDDRSTRETATRRFRSRRTAAVEDCRLSAGGHRTPEMTGATLPAFAVQTTPWRSSAAEPRQCRLTAPTDVAHHDVHQPGAPIRPSAHRELPARHREQVTSAHDSLYRHIHFHLAVVDWCFSHTHAR
jgi:hypothetical protein